MVQSLNLTLCDQAANEKGQAIGPGRCDPTSGMGQALQKFDVRTTFALRRGCSLRAQQVQRLRRVGVLVPPAADDPEARVPAVHEVASAETMKTRIVRRIGNGSIDNGFDATRRKLGVTGQAVDQLLDNPNDVTVTHDFKTADKAKSFASSSDLKTTMEKAGVKGTPQVWFTTSAAK